MHSLKKLIVMIALMASVFPLPNITFSQSPNNSPQRQVWQALQEILYGATRTYAELAEAIGRPTASRAVDNAIGSNPVAMVIPCHRVIRSDGSLGGYRWGIERKKYLLDQEQHALQQS